MEILEALHINGLYSGVFALSKRGMKGKGSCPIKYTASLGELECQSDCELFDEHENCCITYSALDELRSYLGNK